MAVTMVQGVAAVAVSTALEMAARALVKKAARWPLSLGSDKTKALDKGNQSYFPIETSTESYSVWIRRTRVR
jgi:hypothetical protein